MSGGLLIFIALLCCVAAYLFAKTRSEQSRPGPGLTVKVSRDGDDDGGDRRTIEHNLPWLLARWQRADEIRSTGGKLDPFPYWYFDPVTDPQKRALAKIKAAIPGDLTKGRASDIIGLYCSPDEEDEEILAFFDVSLPLLQRNDSRTADRARELLADPVSGEAWRTRKQRPTAAKKPKKRKT